MYQKKPNKNFHKFLIYFFFILLTCGVYTLFKSCGFFLPQDSYISDSEVMANAAFSGIATVVLFWFGCFFLPRKTISNMYPEESKPAERNEGQPPLAETSSDEENTENVIESSNPIIRFLQNDNALICISIALASLVCIFMLVHAFTI